MNPIYTNSLSGGIVAVSVVVFVLLAVVAIVTLVQGARERHRRFDLIEVALRNPSLSPESQRELLRSLQPVRGKTPFVVGWFGLFGGIGWLCAEPSGSKLTMAILLTVLGFALLTLPFALRELELRRA